MGKRVAFLGMAVSLALIVSYVETLIPFQLGIPGAKLGLTNIVILIVLYRWDFRDAIFVSVLRILLAGFMFGSLSTILYSLAGGLASLCVMQGLHRAGRNFGIVGISTAGGVAHNTGQLLIAMAVVENISLFYYAPFLILAGILTGLVVGAAAGAVLAKLPDSIK